MPGPAIAPPTISSCDRPNWGALPNRGGPHGGQWRRGHSLSRVPTCNTKVARLTIFRLPRIRRERPNQFGTGVSDAKPGAFDVALRNAGGGRDANGEIATSFKRPRNAGVEER